MTERDPATQPQETLDSLEESVLGERQDRRRDEDDTDAPAFEQDIDTDRDGDDGDDGDDGEVAQRRDEPPV